MLAPAGRRQLRVTKPVSFSGSAKFPFLRPVRDVSRASSGKLSTRYLTAMLRPSGRYGGPGVVEAPVPPLAHATLNVKELGIGRTG